MNKRLLKKKYKEMENNPIVFIVQYFDEYDLTMKQFVNHYSYLKHVNMIIVCRSNHDDQDTATAISFIRYKHNTVSYAINRNITMDNIRKVFESYRGSGDTAMLCLDKVIDGDIEHPLSKRFDYFIDTVVNYFANNNLNRRFRYVDKP